MSMSLFFLNEPTQLWFLCSSRPVNHETKTSRISPLVTPAGVSVPGRTFLAHGTIAVLESNLVVVVVVVVRMFGESHSVRAFFWI